MTGSIWVANPSLTWWPGLPALGFKGLGLRGEGVKGFGVLGGAY